MSRFYICLVILALIIGVCSYSLSLFTSTSAEMVGLLNGIEVSALAGEDKALVSQKCADYTELWKKKEKKLIRFIRHPQLDAISSETAELRYLATDEGYSHLLATIERIKAGLEKIGDAELYNG